jgi:putative membrane protein insertion efficiency factor
MPRRGGPEVAQPPLPAGTGALRALPRRLAIGLVKAYRLLLSPSLGSNCRFWPTCSAYAIEALERHGARTGLRLTGTRLLRCHPWCEGGLDPVPEQPRRLGEGLFTGLAGMVRPAPRRPRP